MCIRDRRRILSTRKESIPYSRKGVNASKGCSAGSSGGSASSKVSSTTPLRYDSVSSCSKSRLVIVTYVPSAYSFACTTSNPTRDPAPSARGPQDLSHALIPVSYTHLDVYKRQRNSIVCNSQCNKRSFFMAPLRHTINATNKSQIFNKVNTS